MTPTEFPHLQRSDVFVREHDQPTAAAAHVDRKWLIIGGSIGLFMLICAITFMVQGFIRCYLKKRRQGKEVEGYSLELQEARREKAAERVDNGDEGAGVKAVATGKSVGSE
jgi:hypothetical protein